ncbi:uncharacterized protein [Physcomitrium patens]|uniref:3D domain-containing protein n=1 Tax=Physcomitrium patens TaxID=3218 RepID=A0A2K1L867_PHYPA|nr:uncharacterized protein LOC112287588 isoform X2 [Physcomitrium patens]PNR62184.1 hypothetical protein PHYPA_000608 [Physcomitrium patens]|eukprot:XP_024386503.1 uncharacterized protein LOC112287588 isoform X2 [Physcomitrella patens]
MPPYTLEIECTAYCRCGYCCNWEWGLRLPSAFPFYLGFSPSLMPVRLRTRKKGNREHQRLPFFCKFWTATTQNGQPYYGLTSNGSFPAQARPPLFSKLSLMNYQNLPARLLFFPWKLLPRHGTIAADTNYYPFGTRMFIPGYGWGEVEDRGGAIKGPHRIDLYHRSHKTALQWGRRKVQVLVIKPGQSRLDSMNIPRPVKSALKGLNWIRSLLF